MERRQSARADVPGGDWKRFRYSIMDGHHTFFFKNNGLCDMNFNIIRFFFTHIKQSIAEEFEASRGSCSNSDSVRKCAAILHVAFYLLSRSLQLAFYLTTAINCPPHQVLEDEKLSSLLCTGDS